MKLFFAQLEENREPYIDLFGDVCDEVIAWLMFLSAKRFITQEKYTVQDALDLMSDLPGVPVDFGGGIQGPASDVETIRAYFTKPKWSKPADVQLNKIIVDRNRGGMIVQWDYTDVWKARQQKKADRELHKAVSDYEAKCRAKK